VSDVGAPRPAATVMLVRDRDAGFEVLMLQRNLNSDFVGGAYVFPGGGVDSGDANVDVGDGSLDDAAASARLGLASGGLAYYVACLRELFEEAGVLLAVDSAGQSVQFDDDGRLRFAEHRRRVNAKDARFVDVLASEDLRADLRALEYIAHWVTPVGPPRRYDTRFFVARAPEGQIAAHDAGETVADVWVRPHDALARHDAGELEMIFPTIKNLELVADCADADAVLAFARNRRDIPKVEPRIVMNDHDVKILLPGDDGFDD
jgi:8-oxo-dGTP pyrophosphatase MutT (NUDIX family)